MKSLNVRRSVSIEPQLTAEQWDLYTSTMDCDEVAGLLNATLKDTVNRGLGRGDVEQAMLLVMQQYKDYGTCDSEPYWVLQGVLDNLFGNND